MKNRWIFPALIAALQCGAKVGFRVLAKLMNITVDTLGIMVVIAIARDSDNNLTSRFLVVC